MTRYLESETSSTHIIKVYIRCIDRDIAFSGLLNYRLADEAVVEANLDPLAHVVKNSAVLNKKND
jgi:hypothetical protein